MNSKSFLSKGKSFLFLFFALFFFFLFPRAARHHTDPQKSLFLGPGAPEGTYFRSSPPSFWLLQLQSQAVWCSGQAATSVTSRPHQTGTRSKVKLGSSPLVTRRQLHPWGALGSPQPGGEPGGDPWPVLGMLPQVAFCIPSPSK